MLPPGLKTTRRRGRPGRMRLDESRAGRNRDNLGSGSTTSLQKKSGSGSVNCIGLLKPEIDLALVLCGRHETQENKTRLKAIVVTVTSFAKKETTNKGPSSCHGHLLQRAPPYWLICIHLCSTKKILTPAHGEREIATKVVAAAPEKGGASPDVTDPSRKTNSQVVTVKSR